MFGGLDACAVENKPAEKGKQAHRAAQAQGMGSSFDDTEDSEEPVESRRAEVQGSCETLDRPGDSKEGETKMDGGSSARSTQEAPSESPQSHWELGPAMNNGSPPSSPSSQSSNTEQRGRLEGTYGQVSLWWIWFIDTYVCMYIEAIRRIGIVLVLVMGIDKAKLGWCSHSEDKGKTRSRNDRAAWN